MNQPISIILREFLTTRRILAEVARRLDKKLPTLASELNPKVGNAKFALDDFEKLCSVVKQIGYGGEMDEILDNYFGTLKDYPVESESTEDLAVLSANLMAKTAALANGTMRLIDSSDDQQLREVKQMIRSELIPTSMRLLSIIDSRLSDDNLGSESLLPTT